MPLTACHSTCIHTQCTHAASLSRAILHDEPRTIMPLWNNRWFQSDILFDLKKKKTQYSQYGPEQSSEWNAIAWKYEGIPTAMLELFESYSYNPHIYIYIDSCTKKICVQVQQSWLLQIREFRFHLLCQSRNNNITYIILYRDLHDVPKCSRMLSIPRLHIHFQLSGLFPKALVSSRAQSRWRDQDRPWKPQQALLGLWHTCTWCYMICMCVINKNIKVLT